MAFSRSVTKLKKIWRIGLFKSPMNAHFAAFIPRPQLDVAQKSDSIKKKFDELVIKYEQLTGMDEVRRMQNRVIEAQDKFIASQEKRRNVTSALAQIQSKLKEIYSELDTTSRGEERYLQLITQEHAVLKEEKKLRLEYELVEREERESFSYLSACVKESHEKERAQAERTKYWSIIGSIIGTIIGVLGSSVSNEFKMREMRKLVKEAVAKGNAGREELSKLLASITSSNSHQEIENKMGQLIALTSAPRSEESLEHLILEQARETRLLCLGVTVVGIVIPIFVYLLNK